MRLLRKRRSAVVLTVIEIISLPQLIMGDSILDWLGNPLGSLKRSFQTHRKASASAREEGWHRKQSRAFLRDSNDYDDSSMKSHLTESHFTEAYFDDDEDTYDADQSHLILSPVRSAAIRPEDTETTDGIDERIEYDSSDAEDGFADESRIDPASAPTIVYRFYGGKSTLAPRTTRFSPTAIPIVCIGPNVDHWKPVAQELSSRGYNVIVCERVKPPDPPKTGRQRRQDPPVHDADANAWLVRKLLDALRWNQVVLVGCDSESLVAIQATMRLAPQRVVGLALCGNLDACTKQLLEQEQQALLEGAYNFSPMSASTIAKRKFGPLALDEFLYDHIKCPFRIISDATAPSSRSLRTPSFSHETPGSSKDSTEWVDKQRCQIIGGGTAPHRRRPEQFAWTLSRFVEELIAAPGSLTARLAPPRARGGQQPPPDRHPASQPTTDGDAPFWVAWQSKLSELRERVFSPFSFTVGGRLIATAIFYTICLKVAIYQFDNFRVGVNTISSIKKRLVGAVSSVFAIVSLSERDGEIATESISKDESAPVVTKIEQSLDRNETTVEGDGGGNDESKPPAEQKSEDKASPDDGHYRPSFFIDNVIA